MYYNKKSLKGNLRYVLEASEQRESTGGAAVEKVEKVRGDKSILKHFQDKKSDEEAPIKAV